MSKRSSYFVCNCLQASLRTDLGAEAKILRQVWEPLYRGECFRLLGECVHWQSADAKLRFTKEPIPSARTIPRAEAEESMLAIRQKLTLHLLNGWVSFQVASCINVDGLRLYPAAGNVVGEEPFRLKLGDSSHISVAV